MPRRRGPSFIDRSLLYRYKIEFVIHYIFVFLPRIVSFEQTLHFPLFLILQIKMRMMAAGLNGAPLEIVTFREESAKEQGTGIAIRQKHLKEDYRV